MMKEEGGGGREGGGGLPACESRVSAVALRSSFPFAHTRIYKRREKERERERGCVCVFACVQIRVRESAAPGSSPSQPRGSVRATSGAC